MKIKQIIGSYLPNKIRFWPKYDIYLKELYKLEKLNAQEIKDWQLKKLNEILEYSYNNIAYYRKLFIENNIKLPLKKLEDIKQIPYLSKKEIRENFKELLSKENIKSNYMNTGGSTGTPLKLKKSIDNHIKEIVFLDFYMQKLGLKGFKTRKALLRGNIPKKGISERIGNQLILSSYLISETTVNEYISLLEEFNPEILHVYPSSIYSIAKLVEKNNLKIKVSKLKVIFSSSEIFTKFQKELVSKVFKCHIFDLYGNTETTVQAINLFPEESYKFNDFYSYVEVIDNQIITTSFNDLVMPLIRYKTDDEVDYSKNGRDFIIKGRTQDYIYGKNRETFPVVGVIFGQHFSFFKKINNFQIIQNKLGKITFLIEGKKLDLKEEKEIRNTISKATNNLIRIKIEYIDQIERTNRGKYKFLIQNTKQN